MTFHAIDIERDCLSRGARRLLETYDRLDVVGLIGEFGHGLDYLRREPGPPRLVIFLGSTIGNFDESELDQFFTLVRHSLRVDDRLLIGFDLPKSPAVLVAAYDDAQGVTAQFNLNVLARINRELDADFDLSTFRHRAIFSAAHSRIEMHLESLCDQRVRIGSIGMEFDFRRGESIHTENCYKHSRAALTDSLTRHRLQVRQSYTDSAEQFCLFLIAGPGHP